MNLIVVTLFYIKCGREVRSVSTGLISGSIDTSNEGWADRHAGSAEGLPARARG
jgi:hypothetical protein